jgi:hypothetical protein
VCFGKVKQKNQGTVYFYPSSLALFDILTVVDSIDNNAQLHVIIEDLQGCLDNLWDDLPLDTVIASILDPRTKWFPRIPANEITEALSCMKKVCYIF